MTDVARPVLAELVIPSGWSAIYAESGPEATADEIAVTHTAPNCWGINYSSGAQLLANSREVVVWDGVVQATLAAADTEVLFPAGLAMLGTPHISFLQRLLEQAVEIHPDRWKQESIWRVVSQDGSSFVLDRHVRMGHAYSSSSYSAELRDLALTVPSEATYEALERPAAVRLELGRFGVRLNDSDQVAFFGRPEREIYLYCHHWATEVGPELHSMERALEWCEERAAAIQVSVDGPRGREIFGVGSWSGQEFRAIPKWLRER